VFVVLTVKENKTEIIHKQKVHVWWRNVIDLIVHLMNKSLY